MKINPFDQISKNAYPEKIKKPEKPIGKEFGSILEETIENSSKVATEAQKPPTINNVSNVQFNTFPPVKNIPIIENIAKFLNILDEYQQKLGNSQFTLKDIYPLINHMEAEKENLIPVFDSLPDGDGLKDILNQALITSSVEIIKFNRGDYLNP